MGIALSIGHYMLYDSAALQNIESGAVTVPAFATNEIVLAALLGSAIGVVVSTLLRSVARVAAGCGGWPRVDDKDDFEHLFDNLVYAEGAVLRMPNIPYECLGYLDLTPKQVAVLKHILECGISECSLKARINDPQCAPELNCCYSKNQDESQPITVDLIDPPEVAGKRTFASSIKGEMSQLWHEDIGTNQQFVPRSTLSKISHRVSTRRHTSPSFRKISHRPSRLRPTSPSPTKTGRKCRKLLNQGVTPFVSARVVSPDPSNSSLDTQSSDRETLEGKESEHSEHFDSLSEGESDQELATRGARTDSEINLTRRPDYIYSIAPRWNADHHVWVQAANGGDEHHRELYQRYERTIDPGPRCARIDGDLGKFRPEDVILEYIEEERLVFPGGLRDDPKTLYTFICGLGAFLATGTIAFVIYQRLPLPDSDSLVYLYAVMLILVFEPLFSTVNAILWALVAMWARRNRILKARRRNARMFRRMQI